MRDAAESKHAENFAMFTKKGLVSCEEQRLCLHWVGRCADHRSSEVNDD
jgi:hypothetical protein